jgi:hypothetical protein
MSFKGFFLQELIIQFWKPLFLSQKNGVCNMSTERALSQAACCGGIEASCEGQKERTGHEKYIISYIAFITLQSKA